MLFRYAALSLGSWCPSRRNLRLYFWRSCTENCNRLCHSASHVWQWHPWNCYLRQVSARLEWRQIKNTVRVRMNSANGQSQHNICPLQTVQSHYKAFGSGIANNVWRNLLRIGLKIMACWLEENSPFVWRRSSAWSVCAVPNSYHYGPVTDS